MAETGGDEEAERGREAEEAGRTGTAGSGAARSARWDTANLVSMRRVSVEIPERESVLVLVAANVPLTGRRGADEKGVGNNMRRDVVVGGVWRLGAAEVLHNE